MIPYANYSDARRWAVGAVPASILAALVSLSIPSSVSGDETSDTMDVSAFSAQLQVLHAQVDEATAGDAARLASTLPAAWHVRSGDDAHRVGTGPLSEPLNEAAVRPDRWPAIRQVLLHRLAVLRAHAEEAQDGAGPSYAGERRHLDALLKGREFSRRAEAGVAQQLGERIRAWLRSLLSRVLPEGTTMRGVGEALAWLTGLAALAGLSVWLLRLRRVSRGAAPIAEHLSPRLSSREWVASARQAIERGDAREAVRCAYLAVIFRFEEQGVWRVDDTRTPREYERLLMAAELKFGPAGDALRTAFRDLTRQFEQTWYGARPADSVILWQCLEQCGCVPPRQPAI